MLVSVMSIGLLKVAVVGAVFGAIVNFSWLGDTYHNQVVIVQWNCVGKYCGPVLLS